MTDQLDIRDEIDAAPVGRAHWAIVATLGLLTLFDGYDTFIPAYVIHFAMHDWHLKPSQAGLLVSSGLIGFMVGSLANGSVADRIGRKPTLLAGLVIACIFNIATAVFARSFELFLALRFLTGIGLGVLLPLAVTYINETLPGRVTNIMVGWVMVGWSIGGILAAVVGLWLTPTFGWPALFWAAGLGIPLLGLCAVVLPESPRFLALQGRQADTRRVMARLVPAAAVRYADATFAIREDTAHRGSIARLLAPQYRRSTLVIWLCAAGSLFAIFGLSSSVPNVMIQRGESFGAGFMFGGILQVMSLIGGLGCGWAADRLGDRRAVLTGSWILGAAAIAGLAFVNLHWTNLLFVSVAGFFIMGAQPVLNNLAASLYETEIRGTGVGVELGVGRIGGILGPYIGGWLQQLFPGSTALFLAMAVTVAVSALSLLAAKTARPQRGPGGDALIRGSA